MAPVPPARGRRNLRVVAAAAAVLLGAVGAAALVNVGAGDSPTKAAATTANDTTTTGSTTVPCEPLPYQPCGDPPAPHTDGTACIADHDDYDEDPVNGCEATPDLFEEGAELSEELEANLVPADDVDTYDLKVTDNFQIDCSGEIHVELTAPAGVSMRVTVLDGTDELGSAVSGDGEPAEVSVRDPNCGSNDDSTLSVRVQSVGSDRTDERYVLSERGSF